MPSTEVVLTENVPGLGAEADVVKVRRGYARNFLLPHGKAYEVTPASMRQLDSLKKKRAEREARELNDAEELSRRIGKLRVTFTLETGETGKAFGSITAHDIVTRIKTRSAPKSIVIRLCSSIRSRRQANIKSRSSCTTTWQRNLLSR